MYVLKPKSEVISVSESQVQKCGLNWVPANITPVLNS